MLTKEQHILFWKESADEDWETAKGSYATLHYVNMQMQKVEVLKNG